MKLQESHSQTANNKTTGSQASYLQKLSQNDLCSIVESILFASSKSLSTQDLSNMLSKEKISTATIKNTLSILTEKYNATDSGIELVTVANAWQMRTKEENKNYVRRLIKGRLFQLSAPAMEVLSIVAYHQPCRKADIDDVRGVESGHLLKTLIERNLICFGPKSSLPGKPITYKTTNKFLEVFGLKSLKQLPSSSDIEDLMQGECQASSNISELQKNLQIEKNFKTEQQKITKELETVSEKIKSIQVKSIVQDHEK